nr:MAG TPA: hypothetical protein [Caudoviricetes sp.]DAG30839.1 MAG TPA: hypothetical protein [Caudoviricetes sp.]
MTYGICKEHSALPGSEGRVRVAGQAHISG